MLGNIHKVVFVRVDGETCFGGMVKMVKWDHRPKDNI